ncbi:hypothetical protein FVE85_2696 [Porphyridium purpureum]|uniref:Uncharacterized protein n=1 Tax=Porphyridium purpureum TaxID=35688 RepID=A0A5J4YTB7_PORPP|nr:hypothetical protein FVE85_2696 [Porphyridium purpureum]|eukprot:POR7491..scf227_4
MPTIAGASRDESARLLGERAARGDRGALDGTFPAEFKYFTVFVLTCMLALCGVVIWRAEHPPKTPTFDEYMQRALDLYKQRGGKTYDHLLRNTCDTHVYLLRHADKGREHVHLSARGFQRAQHLTRIFCSAHDVAARKGECRFIAPDVVFARKAEFPRYVLRSIETVTPLAQQLNLTVESQYSAMLQWSLVVRVLGEIASFQHCGRAVLVCWKHSLLPAIQEQFGCGTKLQKACERVTWHKKDFDTVLDLHYAHRAPHGWELGMQRKRQHFIDE